MNNDHFISIKTDSPEEVITRLSDQILEMGGTVLNERVPGSISFSFYFFGRQVVLKTTDPFFNQSGSFENPNDFFLPLSSSLNGSAVRVIDYDEKHDVFQYWVFQNGSCKGQFFSNWRKLPESEQADVKGSAVLLTENFPNTEHEIWKTWLTLEKSGKQQYLEFLKFSNLDQSAEKIKEMHCKLPAVSPRPVSRIRHFFPWVLIAAPSAYFTLRYQAEPEVVPAPHTPTDNRDLPGLHKHLLVSGLEYFGDFNVSLIKGIQTFVRLYGRTADCVQLAISRTQTPLEALWHTEISTNFKDGSRITTTNAEANPDLMIPKRRIVWEPGIHDVPELLKVHETSTRQFALNRHPECVVDSDYAQTMTRYIKQDYRYLLEMGLLRRVREGEYGLSIKGAFKMLYHQWKSDRS